MPRFMLRGFTVAGVLVLGSFAAPSAGAQEAFANLTRTLRPGDVLIVTDTNGGRSKGALVELTDTSILIFADGQRRNFPMQDVERIQRRRNGIALGAIIGAATGGALFALGSALNEGGVEADYNEAVALGWTLGLSTAIGIGIDALLVVPRTVYRRPVDGVAVAPFISPSAAGVRVTVAF